MKRFLISSVQFIFTSFVTIKILFKNIKKIRAIDRIFINSQGFGHSVLDTMAYIEHYKKSGLVISMGTCFNQHPGTERNNSFNIYFNKDQIISLNIPVKFLRKYNWRFLHPIVKLITVSFCLIIFRKKIIIDEDNYKVNKFILTTTLSDKLSISNKFSGILVDKICSDFILAENHHQAPHTILFLLKQYSGNIELIYSILNKKLRDRIEIDMRSHVCLAIRRGNADYHSKANYYFKAVELLYSYGFKVTLIGDKDYFINTAEKIGFKYKEKITNFDIDKFDSKKFDLIALHSCNFAIGDQGGVWSLVNAFNKPGLLINTSPISQLQYNVETLPRQWIFDSTDSEVTDSRLIFGQLFNRYKPLLTQKGRVFQRENEEAFILNILNRYILSRDYLSLVTMQEGLKDMFTENMTLKIANNSRYSNEYLEKLSF